MSKEATAAAPKRKYVRKAGSTTESANSDMDQTQAAGDGAALLDKPTNTTTPDDGTAAQFAPKAKDAKAPEGGAKTDSTSSASGDAGQGEDAPSEIITDEAGRMRGGTKRVVISEMPVFSRGGRNTTHEEPYPFSVLPMSQRQPDGSVLGPSFFIPEKDNPDQCVATARKRVRNTDVQYITRKTEEVVEGEEAKGPQKGLRVWKASAGTLK